MESIKRIALGALALTAIGVASYHLSPKHQPHMVATSAASVVEEVADAEIAAEPPAAIATINPPHKVVAEQ